MENEAEAVKIQEVQLEDKPVTIDNLKNVWNLFLNEKRSELKPSEVVILNQSYTLEANKIILKLTNPVQIEQLNGFRVELLSFLRRKLQNSSLDISPVITEEEEKKIIYTSSDKFNYLLKKNPALMELKLKLGLDLDYS